VASLKRRHECQNATATRSRQQFVTTAWNIVFAIVLLVWVFGWSGGKELVSTSYTDAKEKAASKRPPTTRGKRQEKKPRPRQKCIEAVQNERTGIGFASRC